MDGANVVVRDPREPSDAPSAQSYRRFKVTGSFEPATAQSEVHQAMAPIALQWFVDGFDTGLRTQGGEGGGERPPWPDDSFGFLRILNPSLLNLHAIGWNLPIDGRRPG